MVTAKDSVHLKTSSTSKLNIRVQAYCYNHMIRFDLYTISMKTVG